jgi:asparagine synthase (glutamine-hydrolysing)
MCGIVAMFSNDRPISPQALTRATAALHHRGPDGQRQWISASGRMGLGHARLSIIDLVTGDQPIANEDETIRVVVNGEFYDYERIQKELEARGHRLRTRSDSEILLHLYEDFGVHCMEHLRGEFAFVLWDEADGVLFAGRDRFGIKPLYYAQVGDTLYFASEAKALFAAGVPARWDRESVYQDVMAVLDGDRSLFEGVYQVPPGHYLFASRNHVRVTRYWDLGYPTLGGAIIARSDAEHVERFREKLDEAIRLRLRADVPVGCYLSGGLDSCSLLGIAASHRSDPIQAFTIAFEEGPFDEGPIAEEMAARAGADFHRFPMPEDMLAAHFADAIAQCEMMTFNANCVAKYLLSRGVRDSGFKVVLTGEGSDEILGGYPFFRRDMMVHGAGADSATTTQRLGKLYEANKQYGAFGAPPGDMLPLDGVRRVLGFAPAVLENFAGRGLRIQSLLAPEFAGEFRGRDPYRVLLDRLDVAGQMRGREALHQSMYLWSKTVFPNKLLNFLGDRMEMAHSIEGRTPFLDHHLVEAVVQMPASLKVRDLTEKYILREAARPYLTDTVYNRQKHPFLAPIELKSGLFELVQDTLRGRILASVPFFEQRSVVEMLDRLAATDDQQQRGLLFPMLVLITTSCILQERYHL